MSSQGVDLVTPAEVDGIKIWRFFWLATRQLGSCIGYLVRRHMRGWMVVNFFGRRLKAALQWHRRPIEWWTAADRLGLTHRRGAGLRMRSGKSCEY